MAQDESTERSVSLVRAWRLLVRLVAPRRLVPLTIATAIAVTGMSALGFFTAPGQGTATASAGTLPAPTLSSATAGGGTVDLEWSTVTPPSGPGPVAYYVTRDGGVPTGCPTSVSPATTTSCSDTGLAAGSHSYTVTAVWHSWTTSSATVHVTLASGAPSMLAFTVQPSSAVAGTTMTALKISVEDADGNVVTTDSLTAVALAFAANPGGGTLSGGGQVTVSSGVATYPALSIAKVGAGYMLVATDTSGLPAGHPYTAATSSSFDIAPAEASRLVFATQPGSATVGAPFGSQPVVRSQDSFGNDSTVGLGSSRSITVVLLSGSGTLSGTTTVDIGTAAGNGTGVFGGLSIDTAGDKTLQVAAAAGSPSLAAGTSNSFTVAKASPSLAVSAPLSGTAGTAITAATISATLAASSGSNATGTISFVYFQQASAPTTCSGGTTIGTAAVTGNSTYSPSAGFTPTVAGNYWLYASYNGDTNNQAATSACPPSAGQKIVVAKAAPSLAAAAPASGTAGTAVAASSLTATLAASSGSNATGTITFTYFQQASAPTTCSGGTTIGTATATGNSIYNPSAGFTPTLAGNYWLYASYNGDTNNQAATSACPPGAGQKIVVAKAAPTLTAAAPASGTAGTAITAATISATLAASSGSNATGTITFTYFQQASAPTTCSGGTTIGTATATGNSTYNPSAGFTPTLAGNYWLYASYNGDTNNLTAGSACPPGATQQIVVAKAAPSLAAAAPASGTAGTAVAASSLTATLGASSGSNAGGTIAFTYFQQASSPSTCTGGTAIGTATVTGNGTYNSNVGFTPNVAGNYWLYAAYGGDLNNQAAGSPCPPGAAQKILVAKAAPTLTAAAPASGTAGTAITAATISATLAASSGSNATGTISFVYFQQASAPTTCSGGTTIGTAAVTGNSTYSPSAGFTPTVAGNYWLYASYNGDTNNQAATSACPPSAGQKIVVAKAAPSLAAAAPASGTAGTAVAASSLTATLAASSGSNATGTITFTYFQQASAPTTCSGGTTIGTATATGNSIYNPSAGFTPTLAGNYWLYASYNGDTNNQAATSACPPGATQQIVVAKAAPTLTAAAPSAGTAGTAIAASAITATLAAGSGSNTTGTITFTIFGPQVAPPPPARAAAPPSAPPPSAATTPTTPPAHTHPPQPATTGSTPPTTATQTTRPPPAPAAPP